MRRSAPRNHSYVCMRSDHRDAADFRSSEGKLLVIILEQHDRLLFKSAGYLEAAFHIHHAFLRRIVDHARGEHGP